MRTCDTLLSGGFYCRLEVDETGEHRGKMHVPDMSVPAVAVPEAARHNAGVNNPPSAESQQARIDALLLANNNLVAAQAAHEAERINLMNQIEELKAKLGFLDRLNLTKGEGNQ